MTVQPPPPATSQSSSTSGFSGFINPIQRLTEAQAIAQGYTVIKTAEDFDKIRENLDGKYMLMGHIDLSGFDNWDPIGDSTNKFTGVLDGNGFSVYNLKIDRGGEDWVGLFGFTDGAEIKNLGVQNAEVTGNKYVGTLIGRAEYSQINNCYSSGNLNVLDGVGGGLLGLTAQSTNVKNSHTNIGISSSGTTGRIGGISGSIQQNSKIQNCFSDIDIRNTGTGGRLGGISGSTSSNIVIENCFSNGNINNENTGENIGGIAGFLTGEGKINNCKSYCNIQSNGHLVGGIAGQVSNGEIENCNYKGNLSSKLQSVGGIAGRLALSAGGNLSSIKNCYADGKITGMGCLGGIAGEAPSLSVDIVVMENCFSSMDVTSTWQTGNAGQACTGGIIGLARNINISNCYSTGNVYSTYAEIIGSGFGAIGVNAQVRNCFSTGKVICDDTTTYDAYGGLYGQIEENASIYNSYWNKDTSGIDKYGNETGSFVGTIENVEGLTSAQMDKEFVKTTLGWDEAIWDFSGSMPKLRNMPSFGGYYVPSEYRQFMVGFTDSDDSKIFIDTTFSVTLGNLDYSSAESCVETIEKIDEFIDYVSTKISEIGITMGRFESILESNTIKKENIAGALSTIQDADIAKETADYVKAQILQQTTASLLSQAQNTTNSIVYSLIRGL